MALGRTGIALAGLAVVAFAMLAPVPAPAQQPPASGLTKDDAAKKLEEEQKKLDQAREQQHRLEQSNEELAAEREQLNRRLVELAGRVQQSETELTDTEERLTELSAREQQIRSTLDERKEVIATLLAALQRMGSNPPPVMVTRREDALTQVRSAMLLAAVFPDLRDKALALAKSLGDLEQVVAEARQQATRLVAEQKALGEEQQQLDKLIVFKRDQIAKNEEDLADVRKLAKVQAKTVADLNELIRKLDGAVAQKGTLGEYDKELKQGTAPGQNEPPPAPAPATAEEPTRVAMGNPGRIKPALPFENAKGLLPMPTQGRQILGYGDATRYGSRSKGVAFATRVGAQITSPSDGWVVYAGEFRSYGQLLIINAGGGYHVLLAGLSQIDVTVGQFVLSGEPIGKMGEAPAASSGSTDENAPILYVEFREKERPIDPDPWWAKGPEKVAG